MKSMKEKYALTDAGAKNVRLGAFWTVVVNLVAMFGIGFFFLLMQQLIESLTVGSPLPDIVPYLIGLVVFAVVLWVAHWFQYDYTYGKTYRESGKQRIGLAERLRELPLSFFGKRDLSDLTETIMTDATTMEHVYSHVLPVPVRYFHIDGNNRRMSVGLQLAARNSGSLVSACGLRHPLLVPSIFGSPHAQDAGEGACHDGEHPGDARVRPRDTRDEPGERVSQASGRFHRRP